MEASLEWSLKHYANFWLQDLSYKEKHWHEACFVCAKCRASLVDKQFGSKADRIYCGPCYDAQFATRCDGCGDVFRAGELVHDHFKNQYITNQATFFNYL